LEKINPLSILYPTIIVVENNIKTDKTTIKGKFFFFVMNILNLLKKIKKKKMKKSFGW